MQNLCNTYSYEHLIVIKYGDTTFSAFGNSVIIFTKIFVKLNYYHITSPEQTKRAEGLFFG